MALENFCDFYLNDFGILIRSFEKIAKRNVSKMLEYSEFSLLLHLSIS